MTVLARPVTVSQRTESHRRSVHGISSTVVLLGRTRAEHRTGMTTIHLEEYLLARIAASAKREG